MKDESEPLSYIVVHDFQTLVSKFLLLLISCQITVTWTSGYGADEAVPLVTWGIKDETDRQKSVAGTLTFTKNDMCGTVSEYPLSCGQVFFLRSLRTN